MVYTHNEIYLFLLIVIWLTWTTTFMSPAQSDEPQNVNFPEILLTSFVEGSLITCNTTHRDCSTLFPVVTLCNRYSSLIPSASVEMKFTDFPACIYDCSFLTHVRTSDSWTPLTITYLTKISYNSIWACC